MRLTRIPYSAQLLILYVVYVAAALFGLGFDAVGGYATLVWPPTGIAIASLLLFGHRLWPAVFFGAFTANVLADAPATVALGIGAGNALEAYAAAWLLMRDARFRLTLDDPRSVFSFIGLAAGMSTLLSATIGTTSLLAGGIVPPGAYVETWFAWWIGDIFGALIVAPFLLVWLGRGFSRRAARRHAGETVAMALIMAVAAAIILGLDETVIAPTTAIYVMILPIVWSGVRFGMRGATAALLAFASVAIGAIVMGYGPFVGPSLNEGIAALHLFIGTCSLMALFLGSAHDARIHADAEREAMRREVEDQARYLRAIIDLAPVGIKLLDREGRILRINAAGLKMLEAGSEKDLASKSVPDMTDEADRQAFKDLLKRICEGGEGGLRHVAIGLKGGRRTLDVQMVPFRDGLGRITAALGIFHDVTLEVEQQRKLRAHDEELERVNRALVGRELTMIEMKKDLRRLKGAKKGGEDKA